MSPNKIIVEKSQKILEEYGYQVKTGHLYELFSKLSNESSWNVAKAKNVNFVEALNLEADISILSPTEATTAVKNSWETQRKNLLKQLKEQINKNFKDGKEKFILDSRWFREFQETDSLGHLQSFLAELETMGYLIDPQPKTNLLFISLNPIFKNSNINSFKDFLIKNKPGAVDIKDFLPDYKERIRNNSFKDLMVYGIKEDTGEYLTIDPLSMPGSLFCGGMGSGKSMAARFSAVTHMLSNGDRSLYFFVDPIKGASDYKFLWTHNKENTISVINSFENFVSLVDFLHEEVSSRIELLKETTFPNLRAYNKNQKRSKPVAEIHVFIEEFSAITQSNLIMFHTNVDIEGTTANKLKNLMRVGRSLGIYLNLSSPRATYTDIPGALKPGISHVMCFKVPSINDAAAMNLAHATEILMSEKGRCAYEDGNFLQFPLLTDAMLPELFKEFSKPFKAKLLTKTVSELQKEMKD